MSDVTLTSILGPAYKKAAEAGQSVFKIQMSNLNASESEIKSWYSDQGIKTDVFTNWGFYEVHLL